MNEKHRITKQFRFEMAHRLPSHKGACRFIHGHSYLAEVTVEADSQLNKNGMVVDFKELKGICNQLFDTWDHALMIFNNDPMLDYALDLAHNNFADVVLVPYEPTAENMAKDVFEEIEAEIVLHCYSVVNVRIWETTTSYADYGK